MLTMFFSSFFPSLSKMHLTVLAEIKILHNIYSENAVNCILKQRSILIGPFSCNKSHLIKCGGLLDHFAFLYQIHLLSHALHSYALLF